MERGLFRRWMKMGWPGTGRKGGVLLPALALVVVPVVRPAAAGGLSAEQ